MGVAAQEPLEVGRTLEDRVVLGFLTEAPAIEDDEEEGAVIHDGSSRAEASGRCILARSAADVGQQGSALAPQTLMSSTVLTSLLATWGSRVARTVYRLRLPIGPALPLTLLLGLSTTSCQGLNFYSLQDDVTLGTEAFAEVTKTEKIVLSGPEVDQVRRVTDRLVASALELSPEIASQFQWDVVVIDSPETVNAFCLPGGKMAVYTGILPVTQSDAGLAVVMGHEITHAIRRHGTQRLTRNGIQAGLIAAAFEDEDHQQIAMVLSNFGVGLPWGRSDELEADREGLFVLANAGYDPREAPLFWQRMSQMTGGGGGSALDEFLSTHPSNENRIEQLEGLLPEALPLYEAARAKKTP